MAKKVKKTKSAGAASDGKPARKAKGARAETARPSDMEVNFEHFLRRKFIERDTSRSGKG